jgi:hypoxanthine phosphoribosyltransferase
VKDISVRVLFSSEEIDAACGRLAARIDEDFAGKRPVLLGVLTGAFIFTADLCRKVTIDCDIDFVRMESYGDATSSSGTVKMTMDCKLDLKGRDVIVVEEIVDTGLTLVKLIDELKRLGVGSVTICALVNKHARREVEVPVGYAGIELDDGFLIGYGLDLAELKRNLPDIYVVED